MTDFKVEKRECAFNVYDKTAMFLRVHEGECVLKDGTKIDLSTHAGTASLILEFPDATYLLGFKEFMNMVLAYREKVTKK